MHQAVNKHASKKLDNRRMPKKGEGRAPQIADAAFVARIKECCQARDITTPAEFADYLKVGRTIGHKWYSGRTANLSGKAIFLIADAFQVSPRWLLNGEGPKAAAFRPRSETELRIINAYRVSTAGERAIVDSWLENQEKIHADLLQNEVKFTRRGKNL